MLFWDFAEVCEKLESTTKRTEMVNLTSDFLKKLKPEEIDPAASMLLDRPFPNTSDERFDLSRATLVDFIYRITGINRADTPGRARGIFEKQVRRS
ncbi:MAG: hypothetical protein ABH852_01545 [Methanobacteriota archaeon]